MDMRFYLPEGWIFAMNKYNKDGNPNINYIVTEATKLEGKKVSINVAQMREAFTCLSTVLFHNYYGSKILNVINRSSNTKMLNALYISKK